MLLIMQQHLKQILLDYVVLYFTLISYLRWTVNLLPFFLSLLCSLFFGRSSLETKREDQDEDGDLLDAHSGLIWACRDKNKLLEYKEGATGLKWSGLTANWYKNNPSQSSPMTHRHRGCVGVCICGDSALYCLVSLCQDVSEHQPEGSSV